MLKQPLLLISGATQTERTEHIGHLIVPGSWNKPASLGLTPGKWAMDNGAFGGGFDAGQFMAMLEAFAGQQGCLFVTAPDVIYKSGVGDAAGTRQRWPFWAQLLRGLGHMPAFVAQDGLLIEQVPWDEPFVLFIGGSTAFKEGPVARTLSGVAQARGIWVHWGRVNSRRRYELAMKTGVDSIDGTGFSLFPNKVAQVTEWNERAQNNNAATASVLPT